VTSIAPITAPQNRLRPWSSPERGTVLASLVLLIATIALYYPVSYYPFINFDDDVYITRNPQVQKGLTWSTAEWAFRSTYVADNWHPLTWLSHALDCQIFEGNAGGHHAMNLAFHTLNVLLLFWVLRTAPQGLTERSFMVAALFAIHPINVESVVWISERKNVLSMLFFLLALGAYRWYASQPGLRRYLLVALLYCLGLMAKPQVITLPFVLLLWDYWPLGRLALRPSSSALRQNSSGEISGEKRTANSEWRWLLLEKLPLLALSAASAAVTMRLQAAGGAVVEYALPLRLGNAIFSYVRYLAKAAWPSRLTILYPYPVSGIGIWKVSAALVFLVAISAIVIEKRNRGYLPVGWFWFLGTLVPMIGLVQVGPQAIADRYAYLSFVGLFIMVCWGVADWFQQVRWSPNILRAGSVAVLLVLSAVTYRQIGYWRDSMTLWSHALQVTNDNWVADDKKGELLIAQGKVEEGMPYFYRAVALAPDDPFTNLTIGSYEQKQGRLREAIERYKKVINVAHTSRVIKLQAFNSMCYAYRGLGDTGHADKCFEVVDRMQVYK
jgi:protein O-mannosyl-transferase